MKKKSTKERINQSTTNQLEEIKPTIKPKTINNLYSPRKTEGIKLLLFSITSLSSKSCHSTFLFLAILRPRHCSLMNQHPHFTLARLPTPAAEYIPNSIEITDSETLAAFEGQLRSPVKDLKWIQFLHVSSVCNPSLEVNLNSRYIQHVFVLND